MELESSQQGPRMSIEPMEEILRISRDIGSIQSDIRSTNSRIDGLEISVQSVLTDVKKSQKELGEKLDELISTQRKFEGGWKALTIVGGLVVVIGGFVAWVIDKWSSIKSAVL